MYSTTASGYSLIAPMAAPTLPSTISGSCVWTYYDMIEFFTSHQAQFLNRISFSPHLLRLNQTAANQHSTPFPSH